jgi:DNA-binding CsgD family transcriptional regulator
VHRARDISRRKKSEELLVKMPEISTDMVAASSHTTRAARLAALRPREANSSLIAQAKDSSEIARELSVTVPTLRNHLHSINERLRTHGRLKAVMHAMQRGII